MIEQKFETPSDALQHYGVLGMKWGKSRASGSTVQIKEARGRNYKAKSDINKADAKAAKIVDAGERAVKNKQVQEMKTARLKNPDRVIAARMTTGEKAVTAGIGVVTVASLPLALSIIAGTSARSRRIERKQEKNKY